MRKKIFSFILICTLLTMPLSHVHADYWGGNYGAAMMKQMMEKIAEQIRNAIYSAAKMMAIKQATSKIEDLLYGGSSSPRNIKNFDEFLLENSKDEALTFGEDFLTSALRGTASGDYTSTGGGGGLESILQQAGEGVLSSWESDAAPTTDFADYCSSTTDFFADGDFKCFDAIISNPINTPVGMAIAVDQATAAKYEAEKDVAQLMATSTGTLPQIDDNGNIKLPNSIVEEIQKQQVTLPLQALANGDNNIFSSMIQSFAVSLIVSIVENGLSETEESYDKNSKAFQNQYNDGYDDLSNSVGPSSSYSSDSYNNAQKQNSSGSWKNPDTGKPF